MATSSLSPTEELVLEVLAARYRQGEHLWTFKTKCGSALRSLQGRGLIEVMHGIVENTVRARLTDTGKAAVLSDNYVSPQEETITAIFAETTRWQREAQTPEEKAWANVHRAAITRIVRETAR